MTQIERASFCSATAFMNFSDGLTPDNLPSFDLCDSDPIKDLQALRDQAKLQAQMAQLEGSFVSQSGRQLVRRYHAVVGQIPASSGSKAKGE